MEVLLMADSTTGTVENLALVMANLSHSIEELKATIASLNCTIDSLKAENEYLKNNNELLREENAYLKRKLFGTKSEKIAHSMDQLSLFDEAENECEPELLEDISYTRAKKKQKGKIDIKLDNLKHVKKVYDIDEKDVILDNGACYRVITQEAGYGMNTHASLMSKKLFNDLKKLELIFMSERLTQAAMNKYHDKSLVFWKFDISKMEKLGY